MSTTKSQDNMKNGGRLLETVWLEISAILETEKRRIFDAILNYPPPIPACDIQFNHLLEERARIIQDLIRLREASQNRRDPNDSVKVIREFVDSCTFIDGESGIDQFPYIFVFFNRQHGTQQCHGFRIQVL